MPLRTIFNRLGLRSRWSLELGAALVGLAVGFLLMPGLIFLAGSSVLGRYDGASMGRAYGSVYEGLAAGSVASWIVVLGPCGLYWLARVLAYGWRVGARLA